MKSRTLLIIAIALVVASSAAYYIAMNQAPQSSSVAKKQFIVGVITNPPSLDPAWAGFQQGMKARGYEEGGKVRYIVIPSGEDIAATKKIIEDMVAQNVNAIYVMGSIGARAAKETTQEKYPNLPVVFGVVSNPVEGKLVESLQSSGNNFTGITPINEIIVSKRLEIFLEMVPETKRIIFVWSDLKTTGVENLRNAARTLGVELVEKQVKNVAELKTFLTSFPFKKGDGILRASDSVSGLYAKGMIMLAIEKKIPLSGTNTNDVALGALMSYGANYYKIGGQAARLVDSILKGAKPSDLPIELPEEFEFVINAKTADTIGIAIPSVSLNKANRIIR